MGGCDSMIGLTTANGEVWSSTYASVECYHLEFQMQCRFSCSCRPLFLLLRLEFFLTLLSSSRTSISSLRQRLRSQTSRKGTDTLAGSSSACSDFWYASLSASLHVGVRTELRGENIHEQVLLSPYSTISAFPSRLSEATRGWIIVPLAAYRLSNTAPHNRKVTCRGSQGHNGRRADVRCFARVDDCCLIDGRTAVDAIEFATRGRSQRISSLNSGLKRWSSLSTRFVRLVVASALQESRCHNVGATELERRSQAKPIIRAWLQ